ncbi:hypothetical protein [Roseomonas chloroacetimidivorans]|uniref:hypothetical protein n=1 Tax=Roseomonas chloroacetimidivorans TaxID=1766656 RepID=UPI003C747656
MALLLLGGAANCADAVSVQPSQREAAEPASFATFWPGFREALLAGDAVRLARATQLPLEVRGEADSDRLPSVDARSLGAFLQRVLASDTGLDLRGSLTNRQLVERVGASLTPHPGVTSGGGMARVGDFEFARTSQGWRLRAVYAGKG